MANQPNNQVPIINSNDQITGWKSPNTITAANGTTGTNAPFIWPGGNQSNTQSTKPSTNTNSNPVLPPAQTSSTTNSTSTTTAPPITPTAPALPSIPNDPTAPTNAQATGAMNQLTQTPSQLLASETAAENEAVASSSDIISSIENEFADQMQQASGNAGAAENAAGMAGSPEAASAQEAAIKPIIDQQNVAVQTEIGNIQSQASSDWENAQSTANANAEEVLTAKQTSQQNLQASWKNIATAASATGMTVQQFIQQNPDEGNYILNNAYDGDFNAMSAAFTLAIPTDSVVQSWTSGTTYNQLTRNPQTNKISMQSFDLGVSVPASWSSNKISTTTLMMQDPNNPANTVIYTTDPLTGSVSVSGTGTGTQLAAQYNSSSSSSSSDSGSPADNSSTATSTAATNYITTATSTAGIADPTTPFNTAVNGDGTSANPGVGIGALLAGILKAEGGSPAGVQNNPGNVKYVAGMAGATNSGVAANDGGTFASFDTPEAGQAAAAQSLNDIASSLGPNATVQDVLDKYAHLGGSSSTAQVGSNDLSTSQYGLLANVQGFDPGTPGGKLTDSQAIDQGAYNWLTTYLQTGTVPTSANVLGMRSGSTAALSTIASRAKQLYTEATGQPLPDQDILDSNKSLIEGNNSLLNSLSVQENTIKSNSTLMQGNINAANINQNAPIVNGILDYFSNVFGGNPQVASYLAQNATLSNELGSLLALKNASGTTVHDKLESAGLISKDASASQEAAVVNTLMKEAVNAHAAITVSSALLYQQNDPLQLDPQNPLNNPTQFAGDVGLNLSAIQKDYPDMTPSQIINQYLQGYSQ